jgi:lysophospholipase-2
MPKVEFNRATKHLVVHPSQPHSASMLLIHGLGDSSLGWKDVALELAAALPHVKFVLPTAPESAVSLNGGAVMPSWYDITGLSSRSEETCEGLAESRAHIASLVDGEVQAGIPFDRIVLAGFSQGAALSLVTGLQLPVRLAGVVSLSGYLPKPDEFAPSTASLDTPVLFGHGDEDQVVQLSWARAAEARIKQAGVKQVAFKVYPGMPHSACEEEIDDLKAFLGRVISPPPVSSQEQQRKDQL